MNGTFVPETGLATEVRARRRTLGLRQADLAEISGVSERFVRALESGKPAVQLDRVIAVLDALGLELCLRVRGT